MAEMQDMGTELVGAVREGATSLFEEQRNRAADEIAAFGDMLRRSAQSNGGAIARYAEDAAGAIADFADTIRNRSLSGLAEDVEDLARRSPYVFTGAAVGIGFLAGRFLISSSSRPAPTVMPKAPTTRTGFGSLPQGGARYDHGAVRGSVSGAANAGYGLRGAGSGREVP